MLVRMITIADSVWGRALHWQGGLEVGPGARMISQQCGRDSRSTVGDGSIVFAIIGVEESGGRLSIGNRCFIRKSDLVCFIEIGRALSCREAPPSPITFRAASIGSSARMMCQRGARAARTGLMSRMLR